MNADIYIGVGLIALSLAAVLALAIIRPHFPEAEAQPQPHAEPEGEWQGCMGDNRRCTGVVVSSIKGWDECAAHVAARIERTA